MATDALELASMSFEAATTLLEVVYVEPMGLPCTLLVLPKS